MHLFVTPWTAVGSLSARPAALRSAPPLLLARRPQGRSRNFAARPQRQLLRSEGGVPEIARVFPEQYESLLDEKVERLQSLLADAVQHHERLDARRAAPERHRLLQEARAGGGAAGSARLPW